MGREGEAAVVLISPLMLPTAKAGCRSKLVKPFLPFASIAVRSQASLLPSNEMD